MMTDDEKFRARLAAMPSDAAIAEGFGLALRGLIDREAMPYLDVQTTMTAPDGSRWYIKAEMVSRGSDQQERAYHGIDREDEYGT